MTQSQQLLADYVRNASETAFRELITRYIGLVYSAALRLVEGDRHRAEDVAQIVFIDLARMAPKLPPEVLLGGWLHQHTWFVASNCMRDERRRQQRERRAAEMTELQAPSEDNLKQITPLLDEAITQLGEADRAAILLRFFEQLDFRSVGDALGSSEDAARMRVARALEKLHLLLKSRGISTTAAALSATLSTIAIETVPAGLVCKISAAALTGAASATLLATTKTIAMTTLQKVLVATTLAAAIGTGVYENRQAASWRESYQALQRQQGGMSEQIAQLQVANASFSNQLARTSPPVNSTRLRELLRLRGEVGLLRRQQRELEQALASAGSKIPGLTGQTGNDTPRQTNAPAPFKMQLVSDASDEHSQSVTNSTSGETLRVQEASLLDHTAIQSASVVKNSVSGAPEINVEFSPEGQELFAAITRENINKRLAIVLDGRCYAAPIIRSEISEGKAQITGNFTEEEAKALAAKINELINP